ncbi:hypothetical protein F5Y19DRAFT_418870 [Xylariaceae sp. FL1651]|nr:hypothetical protein F5Y19DRAFT_418870 [Xylariaceae sp. FL1651]
MASTPMKIPRKPVPKPGSLPHRRRPNPASKSQAITLLATTLVVVLLAKVQWSRQWVTSGAAVESLLLLYANGHPEIKIIFPSVPLWTILSTLNLAYAVCSTSWLLYGLFTAACYPAVLLTSLAQFPAAGYQCRRVLRKILGKHPHFIKDKLALFDLPALEIDTEVNGLFVIRGVTIQFSTLTIVAHGIEVGIKLTGDIELAICVDEVTVNLFRHIEIGDVFANIKGGRFEMTLGVLDDDPTDDDISVESVFLDDTPLLRAATAVSEVYRDRPRLKESLTHREYIEDSSTQASLKSVTKLSPDDELADKEYRERLDEIQTTSPIHQSCRRVKQRAQRDEEFKLKDDKTIRAAISQELHSMPSVVHPPSRSVRVTTLRNGSPPYVRRFMHRLPFLLRLLLAPLSYFHSINIKSINAAGSGQWVSELLQQQVFKSYLDKSAELRKLHRKVTSWLAHATFCFQLADMDGLASVPLSTSFDIVAQVKFRDVMAYRTAQQSGAITQVLRLGGADASCAIPSYLLPHHEHILPPEPTPHDKTELKIKVDEADGIPQSVHAEKDLEMAEKDEASIAFSVHANLPATFDQTMLNFVAALVKATKIIELEETVADAAMANTSSPRPSNDDEGPSTGTNSNSRPSSSASCDENNDDVDSPTQKKLDFKDVATFKTVARQIRQNLKDGSYNTAIKEFAKEVHQNTKGGMKKAVVGGLVNDRWIAKIVGKTAMALRKAQGDIGYSGGIPIPLQPYRDRGEAISKLLP